MRKESLVSERKRGKKATTSNASLERKEEKSSPNLAAKLKRRKCIDFEFENGRRVGVAGERGSAHSWYRPDRRKKKFFLNG